MKFHVSLFAALGLLSSTLAAPLSRPFTHDLAKCLVESTTEDDQRALVRWLFTAAATHPAVQELAVIEEEQLESANREMAALVTGLMTVSCREEVRKAVEFDGGDAIEASFEVLGEFAGLRLFSHPNVLLFLNRIEDHLDDDEMSSILSQEDETTDQDVNP
jgi:hypothetical protein